MLATAVVPVIEDATTPTVWPAVRLAEVNVGLNGSPLSETNCGVIGIAGPYNFLPLTDKNLITIFGGARRPETQPINYIDGKRPPMLLAAGTDDTTVSPRNSSDLAEKLTSFGSPVRLVTYPGIGHIGLIAAFAAPLRYLAPARADVCEALGLGQRVPAAAAHGSEAPAR